MKVSRFFIIFTVVILALTVAVNHSFAGFREDYNQAYQTYQAAKSRAEIEASAEAFLKLAERNDAGALKSNSLYWAAECWYDLKDFLRALNGFEKVLILPKSNKEEAARYKVAVCYTRLGWDKSARWELNRFIRDYPSSSLVGRAKKELEGLSK